MAAGSTPAPMTGGGRDGGPVNFQLQVLQVVIQPQLLQDARRLAGKVRSEEVSFRREAPGPGNKLAQSLTRKNGIDARLFELALQAYELGALGLWDLDIRLGKDGDHIARLEDQVLRGVVLKNELSGIEGHQRSGEGLRVHPLNDRIGPIDFRDGKSKRQGWPGQVSSRSLRLRGQRIGCPGHCRVGRSGRCSRNWNRQRRRIVQPDSAASYCLCRGRNSDRCSALEPDSGSGCCCCSVRSSGHWSATHWLVGPGW